ncbi:MAG: tetratricopeptide repeat protein [Acidobacteria bacterium]|nr:tetratricopeptide repeat protein [Acidobacteriota bacterium]
MRRRSSSDSASVASTLVVVALVAAVAYATMRETPADVVRWRPVVGTPGGPSSSRSELARSASSLRAALATDPGEPGASVALAEVLLRLARVDAEPALATEAEQVVRDALSRSPGDYQNQRLLAAVLLSQHRFQDSIAEASRARDQNPKDAMNYGALGDAHLELGNYQEAQAAYDAMMAIRPSAQAYARMSHSFELSGDLEAALNAMQMATEATSPHDPESLAWHLAQLGHLYVEMGRLDDADQAFAHAEFTFPRHPYAAAGQLRVAVANGRLSDALALANELYTAHPGPELAAQVGDLHGALGDAEQAARFYHDAERLERDGWALEEPQPAALARLLADRDLKTDEAVALAERAAADRRDIQTEDALAWAYYRAGRFEDAVTAATRALRTGTRDRRVLYHAAAIHHALGNEHEARRLIETALDGHPTFDLVNAPAARALGRALGVDS